MISDTNTPHSCAPNIFALSMFCACKPLYIRSIKKTKRKRREKKNKKISRYFIEKKSIYRQKAYLQSKNNYTSKFLDTKVKFNNKKVKNWTIHCHSNSTVIIAVVSFTSNSLMALFERVKRVYEASYIEWNTLQIKIKFLFISDTKGGHFLITEIFLRIPSIPD